MTLLAELARLLRHMDPMPPRVLADALAAGALVNRTHAHVTIPAGQLPSPRSAGVEELLVLAETVPAVRSAGRRLRIGPAGGEALLDLEIRQLGPTQRIAGLATANAPLTIRHEQGDHEVDVDGAGYFNVEIPAGPIRIRLHEAESGWI